MFSLFSSTPLLLPDVVTLVGDYLAPLPEEIEPSGNDSKSTTKLKNTPTHVYTYADYQHHSIQLVLYKVLSHGSMPAAFTQKAKTLENIRSRTIELEDLAILNCFSSHFKTVPLLQTQEEDFSLMEAQFQFCLRHNHASPVASICPLTARVERFLHLSSRSSSFHREILLKKERFLPVLPNEPLDHLVQSIVSSYNTPEKVSASETITRKNAQESTIQNISLKVSDFIKQSLLFLTIAGFILICTALKILLTICISMIVSACTAPFVVLAMCLSPECNFNLDIYGIEGLKSFCMGCMALGAAVGLVFSLYQTIRYIQALWKARQYLFLLHRESFSICARLIMHSSLIRPSNR